MPVMDDQDQGQGVPYEGAPEPTPPRDLNPDFLAGVNDGMLGPHAERSGHTLYDYKDIQRQLQGLSDGELKRIPVMPQGSRLEQGATYVDLYDQNAQPFTAMGEMTAGPDNLYVPKADTDYILWNRLTGVTNPERLDEANEGTTQA